MHYNGSENMEHDYGGGRTRVAGNLLLGTITVDTTAAVSTNNVAGNKLDMVGINPALLGARLTAYAKLYEQCRLNKGRLVFVPSVPTTTGGEIALWYSNEGDLNVTTQGLAEQQSTAERSAFNSGSVFLVTTLDINPGDTNLRYADTLTGSFADDVQGLCGVTLMQPITGLPLGPGQVLGQWFFEYDYEFMSPQLDISVIPSNQTTMTLSMAAVTSTFIAINKPVQFFLGATAVTPDFDFGVRPTSTSLLLSFQVTQLNTATNLNQAIWTMMTNKTASPFTFSAGQTFWARTQGPTTWTTAQNSLLLYADQASAAGAVIASTNSASDGQLVWAGTAAGAVTFNLLCTVRYGVIG